MGKQNRGNKAATIVLYLVLALVRAVGAIAYFTDGFCGDFKTFYVYIDGKDVLTETRGYRIAVSDPLTVNEKTPGAARKTIRSKSSPTRIWNMISILRRTGRRIHMTRRKI